MRGVFLDFATVSNNDVSAAPLEKVLDAVELRDVTPQDEIVTVMQDAEVLLTNKCRIDRAIIEALPQLQFIGLSATGFNNVDIEAAREHGIAVANIRAYCTPSVVQHVFTLMLSLNQKLDGYRALLAQGAWKTSPQFTLLDYPIAELAGQKLGIIGWGELGKGVAAVAEAFGMDVMVAEHRGREVREGRVDFDTVLGEADIISLHCPLTPDTDKLFDAEAFKAMKDTAIIINTARGAIIDEAALADALRNGDIAGAGIDVLSEEPPVNGNPLLAADIPNLVLTPHIAWAAVSARQRAVQQMANAIAGFKRGDRINRVD
ncbi:MAG: D-2-hydroxyacid dehydrogenase [Gammaproteobacteria bacterium]|nr:D-2-hydroxyacid dehydrogenase [Gammaproteobacteria bacterium]